jgi:hypothetical protein
MDNKFKISECEGTRYGCCDDGITASCVEGVDILPGCE